MRDIFQKGQKKEKRINEIFEKNRNRFESIHSNNGHNGLSFIYNRLSLDDKNLSDEEIMIRYRNFSNSIQTNTFCAAELEIVSVSAICYFRPHLTKEMIKQGLKMILWSLGDGIDYSILKQFIDKRIIDKEVEPYGGLPDKEGMEWMVKIIVNETELIKKTLAEVIEENNKELK